MDGGPVAGRGAYGDKLVAELEFPGKACTLVTLRPGTFAAAAAGSGRGRHARVQVALDGVAATEQSASKRCRPAT